MRALGVNSRLEAVAATEAASCRVKTGPLDPQKWLADELRGWRAPVPKHMRRDEVVSWVVRA